MSFAFELTSGQWSRSTENWTSALSEFQQHLFCNFVPDPLWTVLTVSVTTFSQNQDQLMTIVTFQIFLHTEKPSMAFARHSFSLSFDPHEKSLNIDINMILPVKFSGVSSNFNNKRLTSSLSCNVLSPG